MNSINWESYSPYEVLCCALERARQVGAANAAVGKARGSAKRLAVAVLMDARAAERAALEELYRRVPPELRPLHFTANRAALFWLVREKERRGNACARCNRRGATKSRTLHFYDPEQGALPLAMAHNGGDLSAVQSVTASSALLCAPCARRAGFAVQRGGQPLLDSIRR